MWPLTRPGGALRALPRKRKMDAIPPGERFEPLRPSKALLLLLDTANAALWLTSDEAEFITGWRLRSTAAAASEAYRSVPSIARKFPPLHVNRLLRGRD